MENGIGPAFLTSIYERALRDRISFGTALLRAYEDGFVEEPVLPARIAATLVENTMEWMRDHDHLRGNVESAWGEIILNDVAEEMPQPTEEFINLLRAIDDVVESEQELGPYLNQIEPLGRDIALAESTGVRIITMGGAKGLTVEAVIVAALENDIIPRPEVTLGEERRLLYVAMTRARQFLFGTWARLRIGPTARSGDGKAGVPRHHSYFFDGGPVASQDGQHYIERRWP